MGMDPKLEVPTILYIYKAYFWGLNFREYPKKKNDQKYGTFTYLYFRILEVPLIL